MDRVAVFVDAGYLFAQGSQELCGRKLERRHISLDHRALIDALKEFADSSHEWNVDDLRVFLECSPMPVGRSAHTEDELKVSAFEGSHPAEAGFSKALAQPDHVERLRQVAEYIAGEVPFADIPALVNQIRSTNQRPPQIDGKLLAMSRRALGGCDLDSTQKQEVRAAFLDALEMRLGEDEKETTGGSN